MPRKVVDAVADPKGNISKVKLEGNARFTSVGKAMELAERGEIENAHKVSNPNGRNYLRTNPDSTTANNLDDMAGDK